MVRRLTSCLLVVIAVLLTGGPELWVVATAEEVQTKTLEGEIVDPAGYLKDSRHGSELADHMYEAVDGGQTLALLETSTGNLYLLLAEAAGEDPNELAYDVVGQSVKLTGRVYERGGLRGIVATSVEPLTPLASNHAEEKE